MNPKATRRDRPTPSCARCYLMKKRCDKKVPSCTRCTQAGASCLGIHRSDKIEVPRSAVQYLESCLAQIEHGAPPLDLPLHEDEIEVANIQKWVLHAAFLAFGSVCTTSVLHDNVGIHYHARLFYASERPPLKIAVRGVYNEEPPRTASRGVEFRALQPGARGIPFNVATKLFTNYIKNVLPKYPCFLESDLVHQFNVFYQDEGNREFDVSDSSCFVVSMILAISSLTSKTHDFWKVASLSESLQQDALRHASFLGCTNFRSLQCFTLLIQMALLLPYTANLWYMSGEAMRMAIALGLHEEIVDDSGPKATQINLRRNLFWTVYHLERTVAIASGCPLAISDEHISTQMPPNIDALEPGSGAQTIRRANIFQSHVKLSQIQSEIHGVQFFDQALPKNTPDYAVWMRRIEQSVQTWQDSLVSDSDIPAWSVNAADHCRLLLYRPCSRNIVPDEICLKAACTAASRTINGHWSILRSGSLTFSLQYVFNVFQAGMVLLYALGNHGAVELGSAIQEEAHHALQLLGPLFDALSIRWPAATDTSHYVKELQDTVLRNITSGDMPRWSASDTNLLAELDFMVTQRRIHSVYHGNVETSRPELSTHSELSPCVNADAFTPMSDELWQEFMSTGFEFLADDSLLLFDETFGTNPALPWNMDSALENIATAQNVAKNTPVDVELLIRSVPTCGYCRTRHVRCDQGFPSCGACASSHRECVYYDAVLQMDIKRRYVFSLYERYKAMSNGSRSNDKFRRMEPLGQRRASNNILIPYPTVDTANANLEYTPPLAHQNWLNLDNWFFGPSSSFIHLRHALSLKNESISAPPHQERRNLLAKVVLPLENPDIQLPSQQMSSALFRLFSKSVNLFYPTVKDQDLSALVTRFHCRNSAIKDHESDIFYLILAIGSQLTRTSRFGLPYAPNVYFHKATHYPEKLRTDWLQLNPLLLLQRQLLICIYLYLSPESGDIWRNLGFAIRLYFDLSHRPTENDDVDEELMAMLFRTLYCLEGQASIAFGRPSLLVIGDKLRDNIMQPISSIVEERVSSYFYRISLLKMQIQSCILSRSCTKEPNTGEHDQFQTYQLELEAWLENWRSGAITALEYDQANEPLIQPVLEAWTTLNYHHTALLLAQVSRTATEDTLQHCDQVVRSCSFLVRHQHKSQLPRLALWGSDMPLAPIFPVNWTTAHLVFSVALIACFDRKQWHPDVEKSTGIARRCLTTLALMESDPSMLSTGLSEVLERLYDTATNNSE